MIDQQNSPTRINETTYSFAEVTQHLQITPHTLRRWSERFVDFLQPGVNTTNSRYNGSDIAALITVQKLLEAGFSYEQVVLQLQPIYAPQQSHELSGSDNGNPTMASSQPIAPPPPTQSVPVQSGNDAFDREQLESHSLENEVVDLNPVNLELPAESKNGSALYPKAMTEVLGTISNGQQAILNSQAASRELLNVVVQDNFNLKEENHKLRERMVQIERSMSEYERREETRKERLESRIRALEGVVGALQQQMAQLVQHHRQRRKRGWFG